MKTTYFLPLFIYVILSFAYGGLPLLIPFVAGVYGVMVFCAMAFHDPVVKGGDKSPFIIPVAIFGSVVLITAVIFNPMTADFLAPFLLWFSLMLLTFFAGSVIIIRDFNRQLNQTMAAQRQRLAESRDPRRKKLVLINPISNIEIGMAWDKATRFPPLSLGILASLTPRDVFDVILIDEHFDPFTYTEADLVGITAFSTYAPRAYDIADIYRKKGVPVIMGGIHASMQTEEALQYVDTVVVGEAEDIWPAVLDDFLADNLQPVYQGTHPELNKMVIPDRSLFDPRYLCATVQTSRGCPNNCNFCSVTAFNGKRYRQRPVDQILAELEAIPNKYIFFVDDNLLGHGKAAEQRAIALFKGMVERKMNKRWMTQTTIDFGIRPEVLKWAAKSGCEMVFLGLESADHDDLMKINKPSHLTRDYSAALKNINRHGISVIGGFIYGIEGETRERMLKKADFIIRNQVDVMQQSKLTAFPGTDLFKIALKENRLLLTDFPRDWEKYNYYFTTYRIDSMSRQELEQAFSDCIKKTYALQTIFLKALKTLWFTKKFQTAVFCLRTNRIYRTLSLANLRRQSSTNTGPLHLQKPLVNDGQPATAAVMDVADDLVRPTDAG